MKNVNSNSLTRKKLLAGLLDGWEAIPEEKKDAIPGLRKFFSSLPQQQLERLQHTFTKFATKSRAIKDNPSLIADIPGVSAVVGMTHLFAIPFQRKDYPSTQDTVSQETLQGLYDNEVIFHRLEGAVPDDDGVLHEHIQLNDVQIEAVLTATKEALGNYSARMVIFSRIDDDTCRLSHQKTQQHRDFNLNTLQARILLALHEKYEAGEEVHYDALIDDFDLTWLRTYGEALMDARATQKREKIRKAVWWLKKVIQQELGIADYIYYEGEYICRKG